LANTCREWVWADLAALSMGGVCNGIYPTDAATQVEYLCTDSASRFLFVEDDEQLDKYLEVRERLPLVERVIVFDMEGLHTLADPMVISLDALRALGRYEEALAAYSQALAINPSSPEAHNNLGNLLRLMGQLHPALLHLQKALEFKPGYPDAIANLVTLKKQLDSMPTAGVHAVNTKAGRSLKPAKTKNTPRKANKIVSPTQKKPAPGKKPVLPAPSRLAVNKSRQTKIAVKKIPKGKPAKSKKKTLNKKK